MAPWNGPNHRSTCYEDVVRVGRVTRMPRGSFEETVPVKFNHNYARLMLLDRVRFNRRSNVAVVIGPRRQDH